MSGKRVVKLGGTQVDIASVVRDPRGIEDIIADALEADFQEARFNQFNQRLFPFADPADLAEWDSFLTERHPPLYMNREMDCQDCSLGPCDLKAGSGQCGLESDAYQARLSLRYACRGSLGQIMDSRELLNYSIKVFGRDKNIEWGKLHDRSDTSHIGLMTGMWPENLGELDKALSYAEEQLTKLLVASHTGLKAEELEQMVFHAGSILLVAMDVAELVKMNCFNFTNASNEEMLKMIDWPPVNILGGLGNVETDKPVLTFVGDNFLPAWCAIKMLQDEGLTEKIEICGIGAVAHDVIRFYDRCRVLGPMTQCKKIVRYGISDVIVAGNSCLNYNFLPDANHVETRVIWTSKERGLGIPDRTDDPVDEIVADLVAGAPGVWIRHQEKAAEVAVKAVQKIKRIKSHIQIEEEKVKEEAGRCRDDCDLCTGNCPNGIILSSAVKKAKSEGLKALTGAEDGCYLCGKCQEVCPEKIPLTDLIVAAFGSRVSEDKFKMRAGRGPVPRVETTAWAFGSMWGNCPGIFHVLGCGDARHRDELGWIAYQLIWRNAIVFVAGCSAGEVARYYNENKQKYIFEEFTSEAQVRNMINCGSCSACAHIVDQALKWSRSGSGIAHYANFAETADVLYNLVAPTLIVWGALPERMYALVAAWARAGMSVVVGPDSAFGWKRYLLGNKWQWENWWTYTTFGGYKRFVEPAPPGMIIPVETKEEAVSAALPAIMRAGDIRDTRQIRLDTYIEFYDKFFKEFPDDWHLFTRSDWELPFRYKSRLLKELKEKHGWEVDRMRAKKAKHPDGRLLEMGEFFNQYSAMALHVTKLPRMISRTQENESKEKRGVG